jgi:hypothetical protein
MLIKLIVLMNLQNDLFKDALGDYIQNALSDLISEALDKAVRSSALFTAQDFISLKRATKKYDLCRKTLYNYHKQGYITLHSSEGKTFVSVRDLENHIRRNPLPRSISDSVHSM